MSMEIYVPALGQGHLSGTVDSVSPAADPRSMLFAVRLLVPNPDGRLRGGMLARLQVPQETKRGALLVPERATFSENGADYVLVAKDGVATKRRLTLGESDGSLVEAIGGVAEGEQVITAGQEFLGDGDKVAIAP